MESQDRVIVMTWDGDEDAPRTWSSTLRIARVLCDTDSARATIIDAQTGIVWARYPERTRATYVPAPPASRLRVKLAARYAGARA